MKDNVKGGALTEVTFYILLSVYEPKHGYAIMQFIEEQTHGRLTLGAGTLYGAITTMQSKGWIRLLDESNGRRKAYIITEDGKEMVNREIVRLEQLMLTAKKTVGGEANE